MKKALILILLLAIGLFLSGCRKTTDINPTNAVALLTINTDFDISISEKTPELKSTSAIEDFKVIIYNSAGEQIRVYDRAGDIPEFIELQIGTYYVVAHSDSLTDAAFESPYFYGRSEDFELNALENKTINVYCKLANCVVSIIYSDDVKQYFSDYYTEVGAPGNILHFEKEESRRGYFGLEPLGIKATLIYSNPDGDMQSKILTGSLLSPEAGKHYEITIDARLNIGYSSINFEFDESEDTVALLITEDTNPEGIVYGDLLITEIMFNPQSVEDTYGEWFEVYNNSLKTIDLNNLVITRDGDVNRHVINGDILLEPGEYYTLARSDDAVAGEKYIYGTDITLTNSIATLAISTFGTDGTDGQEIIDVTYGESGFPRPAGASINLNPLHFDAEEAKSGESWCTATIEYNTGDLGTPGLQNSECE